MDKIDPETARVIDSADPAKQLKVIVQAAPVELPAGETWETWANDAFLRGAIEKSNSKPTRTQTMPNLRTMVATAPAALVKQLAVDPDTRFIRLQPPDVAVEFIKPVIPAYPSSPSTQDSNGG